MKKSGARVHERREFRKGEFSPFNVWLNASENHSASHSDTRIFQRSTYESPGSLQIGVGIIEFPDVG